MLFLGRRIAAPLALALALGGGLAACGGGGGEGKADPSPRATGPSVTAGATLTPGDAELELGDAATLVWRPNQKVSGVVDVSVEKILAGSRKDVARIVITPTPEKLYLYYVQLRIENRGKTDLGWADPRSLPLYIDEGQPLQPAAQLDPRVTFKQCPRKNLPKKFGKGATAEVCLVFVATTRPMQRLVMIPAADDMITWPADVTRPTPTPSAKASTKPSAKATSKPKASPTAG